LLATVRRGRQVQSGKACPLEGASSSPVPQSDCRAQIPACLCKRQATKNLAKLRANGLTVPFPDAVIATLGMENDLEVWARDAHFPAMQRVLTKLNLYQEPP
jgi:hypothetical protein